MFLRVLLVDKISERSECKIQEERDCHIQIMYSTYYPFLIYRFNLHFLLPLRDINDENRMSLSPCFHLTQDDNKRPTELVRVVLK